MMATMPTGTNIVPERSDLEIFDYLPHAFRFTTGVDEKPGHPHRERRSRN
jgi:hypothetical protein